MESPSTAARGATGHILHGMFERYAHRPQDLDHLVQHEAGQYTERYGITTDREAEFLMELLRFVHAVLDNSQNPETWEEYHRAVTGPYAEGVDFPASITASLRFLAG